MIQTAYNYIYTILESLTGEDQPLAEVHRFPNPNPELFPCAMMDIDTGGSQADISANGKWMTQNIIIRTFLRQGASDEKSQQRLAILDTMVRRLTDPDVADYLGDTVQKMDITSITPVIISVDSNQYMMGFDLVLTVSYTMDIHAK